MLDEEQAALMRRCVIAAAPKTLSADQLAGLELVCSGRDGLILLRTGGGKTLLWQLPALQGGGLTVVVVLSVALARSHAGGVHTSARSADHQLPASWWRRLHWR